MPLEHEREPVTRQLRVVQRARKRVPNDLGLIKVFFNTNVIPCRNDVRLLVKKNNKRVPDVAFRMDRNTSIYSGRKQATSGQEGKRG